jgi:peptidoglycan/LPS O-acetylase OafA/YrhL
MLFGPLWLWSLAVASGHMSVVPGLFTTHWPYFFIGVMAFWTSQGVMRPGVLACFLASFVLALWNANSPGVAIALATALALYLAAGSGHLYTLSLTPIAQYLGRISYSLYLTHMLTGCRAVRFGMERFGNGMSQTQVLLMMAFGIAVSIAAAHVFYLLIEKSAMTLSRRVALTSSSLSWRQHASHLGRWIALGRLSH